MGEGKNLFILRIVRFVIISVVSTSTKQLAILLIMRKLHSVSVDQC